MNFNEQMTLLVIGAIIALISSLTPLLLIRLSTNGYRNLLRKQLN